MAAAELLVDPAISKAKFASEVAEFRTQERQYQARGWWLLEACYPDAFIVFAAPQLTPPAVIFGALLNFDNYDIWPPSVRIVDPFSRRPYKHKELPTVMLRQTQKVAVPQFGIIRAERQPLLVAGDPDEIPFLCIPGVREYHNNPGHSGNPWFLHRKSGAGTLYFLVEQLFRYGVEPLKGYQMGIQIVGYAEPEIPE